MRAIILLAVLTISQTATADPLTDMQCNMARACWDGKLDEPLYSYLYSLRSAAYRAQVRHYGRPWDANAAIDYIVAVSRFNREYDALMPKDP